MTEKQLKLFNFIRSFLVHSNRGPSFKEIRDYMSVTSNQTVNDYLNILEREKYIIREKGQWFGIRLGEKGNSGKTAIKFTSVIPKPKNLFVPFFSAYSNIGVINTIVDNLKEGIAVNNDFNTLLLKGGENNGTS